MNPQKTLHLMTQRDQSYGSVRKCCEYCGLMLVARPASFWQEHAWTDDPAEFESLSADNKELTPCWPKTQTADNEGAPES